MTRLHIQRKRIRHLSCSQYKQHQGCDPHYALINAGLSSESKGHSVTGDSIFGRVTFDWRGSRCWYAAMLTDIGPETYGGSGSSNPHLGIESRWYCRTRWCAGNQCSLVRGNTRVARLGGKTRDKQASLSNSRHTFAGHPHIVDPLEQALECLLVGCTRFWASCIVGVRVCVDGMPRKRKLIHRSFVHDRFVQSMSPEFESTGWLPSHAHSMM